SEPGDARGVAEAGHRGRGRACGPVRLRARRRPGGVRLGAFGDPRRAGRGLCRTGPPARCTGLSAGADGRDGAGVHPRPCRTGAADAAGRPGHLFAVQRADLPRGVCRLPAPAALSAEAVMSEWLAAAHLWIKALHVIAIIAWMAGLLYLPRLFVYHCETVPGSGESERFKTMERRLLRAIMNPAMIAAYVFGVLLLLTP